MISIDLIYTRVNNDLSRKNKSGYTSNDEFNRDVNQAQSLLLNFYHRQYGLERRISESVLPFKKSSPLAPDSSGLAVLPDDFRHALSVSCRYIKSACGVSKAINRLVPMPALKPDQRAQVLSGGIYEPDLAAGVAWHEVWPTGIMLYPNVTAELTYLRKPVDANRAVTLDVDKGIDVYDASLSTNLEWPDMEYGNFVSLLMFFKGVSVNESALIQFAQGLTGAINSSN